MAATEVRPSNDQKKLLWAIGLGVGALMALWWTFVGFGGSQKPAIRNRTNVATPSPSPGTARTTQKDELVSPEVLVPIKLPPNVLSATETRRNIFAYYEPPVEVKTTSPPTPTPTPTPPVLLASISPSNVYARTDDFKLEAMGDKFTTTMRIAVDSRELQTSYISPQQLFATVPAALITNPGQRLIMVRSSDGLYSNTVMLNVTPPPTPNYTYVGIIGKPRHIGDTAILQDKGSKEILNVQRGDVLGGRFRVTSIADRELVVVDTNLKIKHTLQLTNEGERGSFPQSRPTPRVQSEDDEP